MKLNGSIMKIKFNILWQCIRILLLKNGCLSSERLPIIADNKSAVNTGTNKNRYPFGYLFLFITYAW